jgi:hypothetical protein
MRHLPGWWSVGCAGVPRARSVLSAEPQTWPRSAGLVGAQGQAFRRGGHHACSTSAREHTAPYADGGASRRARRALVWKILEVSLSQSQSPWSWSREAPSAHPPRIHNDVRDNAAAASDDATKRTSRVQPLRHLGPVSGWRDVTPPEACLMCRYWVGIASLKPDFRGPLRGIVPHLLRPESRSGNQGWRPRYTTSGAFGSHSLSITHLQNLTYSPHLTFAKHVRIWRTSIQP